MLTQLYTSQVDELLKDIPHYKGCFPNDYIKRRKPTKHEYFVLNLQNSNQGGSHWVALINRPDSEYIEYYDSFGLPPTEEVLTYMKRSGKKVIYNSNQIQDMKSNACGYFSAHFIRERSKGINPYDLIYKFSLNDLPRNEKILKKYFNIKA